MRRGAVDALRETAEVNRYHVPHPSRGPPAHGRHLMVPGHRPSLDLPSKEAPDELNTGAKKVVPIRLVIALVATVAPWRRHSPFEWSYG